MLLLRETGHFNDPPMLEVLSWLFLPLLFSSLLPPEQAIHDPFRHVRLPALGDSNVEVESVGMASKEMKKRT